MRECRRGKKKKREREDLSCFIGSKEEEGMKESPFSLCCISDLEPREEGDRSGRAMPNFIDVTRPFSSSVFSEANSILCPPNAPTSPLARVGVYSYGWFSPTVLSPPI